MINVSSAFLAAMANNTAFTCSATITLTDNTVITLSAADFGTTANKITDSAGASTLPLGSAISRTIELNILNTNGRFNNVDFYGAVVDLTLSLRLSATVTDSVFIGEFTVISPATIGKSVTLVAQDAMWRTQNEYKPTLIFPTTIGEMFQDVCELADIPYLSTTFLNSTRVISAAPSGYTMRDILGYIAMCAGGNARVDTDGYMRILTYDIPNLDDDYLYTLDKWISISTDTGDITVTGLKSGDYMIGDVGYVIDVSNPLILGWEQDALDSIAPYMLGSFRKFSGDYIGYPIAEFMDAVKINSGTNSYYSILTDITYTILGRTQFANTAESGTYNSTGNYISPATKTLMEARRLVAEERTARQNATEQLANELASASGMYSSEQEQDDGSVIMYLHNKPLLSDSSNIIKITSDAIGFSTDAGQTYPFGLQLNGNVIANIIAAQGLNADWINTGALKIYDDNDNLIFSADATNKSLYIAPNAVNGYVKAGIIGYNEDDEAITGVAVGKELTETTVEIAGQTYTQINARFMATFTAEKLSFYADGNEVAYMSSNKINITNAHINDVLEISDDWQITADATQGLTVKWVG